MRFIATLLLAALPCAAATLQSPKGAEQAQPVRFAEMTPTITAAVVVSNYVYTLAWSPPASTNVITNYTLYSGPASRTYTNALPCGTNLTRSTQVARGQTVFVAVTATDRDGFQSDYSNELILPPPILRNLVLTVTGTNLQYSTNQFAWKWVSLPTNLTSLSVTNPTGTNVLWRGKGKVSLSWRRQ